MDDSPSSAMRKISPSTFPLLRPALAAFCAAVILTGTAFGQDPGASPTPGGTVSAGAAGFWRCELPGGVYLVALRNIQSVSSHEYVVDGAARVTEVTIATASSVEARFYYLEPVTHNAGIPGAQPATLPMLQQRVQDAATSRAAVEPVWEKVVKNYPATTHAHTVEFRLASLANLKQLEKTLEQAWTTGVGTSVKTE